MLLHRPSNNRLEAPLEDPVARLLREHYPDFGPTLATDKWQSRHNIVLAKETVRQVQIASGLWIPRKLGAPKVHQPRARRARLRVTRVR